MKKLHLLLFRRTLATSTSGPPIRVGLTPDAGRGVFATRNISLGEVIHTAEPVVAHPTLENLTKVCYYCLRRLGHVNPGLSSVHVAGSHSFLSDNHTQRNSRLQIKFCSEKCSRSAEAFYAIEKRANWESFHQFCSEESLKWPLLAKRLVCMVISGMLSKDALDILTHTCVPHDAASSWMLTRKLLLETLRNSGILEEQMAFLSSDWYLGVISRLSLNTFRIELVVEDCINLLAAATASVSGEGVSGSAIYILPSMYNHDCDPNTDISWPENATAILRARRDIEIGEELRITYIDASMSRSSRQQLLQQAFHFVCSCARCKEEY